MGEVALLTYTLGLDRGNCGYKPFQVELPPKKPSARTLPAG